MIKIESNAIEIKQMQQKMQAYFQTHWKLFLAEGIFLIVLGMIAIVVPHFFTVAIVVSLGWILLFGGTFLITRALLFFRMPGFGLWLFMGILQFVIGYLFLAQPLEGILTSNNADDSVFCLGRHRQSFFRIYDAANGSLGLCAFQWCNCFNLSSGRLDGLARHSRMVIRPAFWH